MQTDVHFSSNSIEWPTPQEYFDVLNQEFGFTLDPCATSENAKCSTYYTVADDGLKQDWGTHVVFMNPPYGNPKHPCKLTCNKKACAKRGHHITDYIAGIGDWVKKAYFSSLCGATVVCLIPSRTDTKWWHSYVMNGEVRFIKGRLKFGGHKNPAPFPNALVIFRPQVVN